MQYSAPTVCSLLPRAVSLIPQESLENCDQINMDPSGRLNEGSVILPSHDLAGRQRHRRSSISRMTQEICGNIEISVWVCLNCWSIVSFAARDCPLPAGYMAAGLYLTQQPQAPKHKSCLISEDKTTKQCRLLPACAGGDGFLFLPAFLAKSPKPINDWGRLKLCRTICCKYDHGMTGSCP